MEHIKTLYWPRQGGKTTKLIKLSAEKKYPIIVRDSSTSKEYKQKAKKLGLEIPEPITINQMIALEPDKEKYKEFKKVLIDDADCILNCITCRKLGLEVDTLALVLRNEKGQEINLYGENVNVLYGGEE